MDKYLSGLLKRAPHLYAWEKDYRLRGALWRGVSTSFNFSDYLSRGAKVLELGCGDGKTLSALVNENLRVTGIDVAPAAVKLARKKVGRRAKLIVGNVCELPFRASVFDAVVAVHVLDHLTAGERAKAVTEIKRVLKKNGTVFFQGFSINDARYGKGGEVEANTFRRSNNVWYHYFTVGEVKKLFKGFKEVELQEECSGKRFKGEIVRRCAMKFIGRKR